MIICKTQVKICHKCTSNKSQEHKSRFYRDTLVLLCTCALVLLPAGCSRYLIPMQSNSNYSSASFGPNAIRTICIVELHNKTTYPQVSADVTESLYQAIQKKHLFALSQLKQNDPGWKNMEISPDAPYTLEQVSATRKMLGADAVLIGTVTSYSPYPHMAIGLHLKLIDLRDAKVCWTVEQVWDTADKNTEERIKKYYDRQLRDGFSPLGGQLAVLSPINFLKFVTYDVAETLKPE
jgi:hypothetical protein